MGSNGHTVDCLHINGIGIYKHMYIDCRWYYGYIYIHIQNMHSILYHNNISENNILEYWLYIYTMAIHTLDSGP